MLRHATTVLVALALFGSAPAVAKPAPVDLARSGKWEVNFGKDSCNLLARFGEGDGELIVQLTRFQPGDLQELRLYGKPLKVEGQFFPVSFDFGPVENPQKREVMVGTAGTLPMVVYGPTRLDDWNGKSPSDVAPPFTAADEAKVTSLTIKAPGGKWYRLALGRMDTAMRVMRRCTADLVRSWGYDPAVMESLQSAPKPVGSPGKWLISKDYPDAMLKKFENALIQFRLDVDATGAVTGCSILSQAGEAEFADTTCKLLTKRGKFSPALDSQGKPIRGYYVSSARWTVWH